MGPPDFRLVHDARGTGKRRWRATQVYQPLPLLAYSASRERRFPRARDAGDDDELIPEDRDAEIFEVVLKGTLMTMSFMFDISKYLFFQ